MSNFTTFSCVQSKSHPPMPLQVAHVAATAGVASQPQLTSVVLQRRTCFTYLFTYLYLLAYLLLSTFVHAIPTYLLDMAIVPVTCIAASSSWSDYARMPILSRVAFHAFAEQLAARSMHGKHSCCWRVPAASVAGATVRCSCSCAHVEFEHGGHHV